MAWEQPLAAAEALRSGLASVAGVAVLDGCTAGCSASVASFDPLRVAVNVEGLGLTGYEAAEAVENAHGVVPELCTFKVSRAMRRLNRIALLMQPHDC